MKTTAKILSTLALLFLMSFTTHAQINDWTGKWNTNLEGRYTSKTLGELTITKSSNGEYIGVFPNGKLAGKMTPSGDLIGTYTRTVNSFDKTGMGKIGEFRFVMYADKKSFLGTYKPEGKDGWQPDNWNGTRPPVPTFVQEVEKNDLKKRADALKEYVKKNPIAKKWTGTWETDTFGIFKVWDTGVKYQNTTETRIVGKFFIKGSGDFIDILDVEGSYKGDSSKVLDGSFKHGSRGGLLFITFGTPTDDDFSGSLTYYSNTSSHDFTQKRGKTVSVKGKRTSSAKPNMNTPN